MTADTQAQGDLIALAREIGAGFSYRKIEKGVKPDVTYIWFEPAQLEAFAAALRSPADRVPMPQNADQAAAMALLGEKWLRDNAPERLRAAALQGRAQEGEPSDAWADLWYFVMDEAPTEFERIVTTFSPKVWHQEAHKLMRAKYPYRAALAQESRGVEIREAM